jgi:hypothetical protein
MSVSDASRIIIEDSRVILQIMASLTSNSRGIIYNCNMFIELATKNSTENLGKKGYDVYHA